MKSALWFTKIPLLILFLIGINEHNFKEVIHENL
jgi:hypothetical protein